MRICVIDDNPTVADALVFSLQEHGHDVAVAYSGREGLMRILADPPDVVVTDWRMPEMNGGAVVAEIRARNLAPLVVMMSGAGDVGDTERKVIDVDCHIEKPFKPADLLHVIDRARAARTNRP